MNGAPYALLLEAEAAELPLTLDDDGRIDQLRAYQSAGWVEASIPAAVPGVNGSLIQPPATVHSLTSAGRKIAEQARGSRAKVGRARLMRF